MFALVCKDLNYVQVILKSLYFCDKLFEYEWDLYKLE